MSQTFRHKRIRNNPRGVIVNDQPLAIDRFGCFVVADPRLAAHLWGALGPAGTGEIERVNPPRGRPPPAGQTARKATGARRARAPRNEVKEGS